MGAVRKLRQHRRQPCRAPTAPWAPKGRPEGHLCPPGTLDEGEEGSRGEAASISPRPPQPGLKCPWVSPARALLQPQVRFCSVPAEPLAFRLASSARPLGALTQQRKSPGEKSEEEQEQGRSHGRGSARGAPRPRGEGVPPGRSAALGKGCWSRGKLCAPNDKEISCHMGRFEITGIRCSNFAFLS